LAHGATLAALEEYRAAAALVPDEPSALRASILAGQGQVLMLEGEPHHASELCEEAIPMALAVGAAAVECDALHTLGASYGPPRGSSGSAVGTTRPTCSTKSPSRCPPTSRARCSSPRRRTSRSAAVNWTRRRSISSARSGSPAPT